MVRAQDLLDFEYGPSGCKFQAPVMTPIPGIASAMVMGWTRRMLYLL
jgi:hypothetical protein